MATPGRHTTWREACADFAARHAIGDDLLAALDAFSSPYPRGGPPPPPEAPWAEGFEALERHLGDALDQERVARQLTEDVDPAQAEMFARRVAATESILRALGSPPARVLRVGLRMRLDAIQGAPPPRGRRVRALADYYYSLAAPLLHPEWAASHRHLEQLVADVRWREAAAGVAHATLDGTADGMPLHVNLLRVDPRQVRVRVADLHERTEQGASFASAAGDGAVAAVSGGFFLYSEDDILAPSRRHDPVGLLLIDGRVVNPPVFRRAALLVGPQGEAGIARVGLSDVSVRHEGEPLAMDAWFNRAAGTTGPAAPSFAVVGDTVTAVGVSLAVPLNGFVATAAPSAAQALRPGARLAFGAPRLGSGVRAVQGIAGGPLLLEDGRTCLDMRGEDFWGTAPPITFSQDETGDRNLLARLAAGLDAEGFLLLAAVDGRNVDRALGMTLGDVSRLMGLLGCHTAMNLDGGSSKRMLVAGTPVDLASTEIVAGETSVVGTRPVHTAVLFEPPSS